MMKHQNQGKGEKEGMRDRKSQACWSPADNALFSRFYFQTNFSEEKKDFTRRRIFTGIPIAVS
jgi:hypothetical protein